MVTFGERKVGDGEPCFITFEAGPTHDGLESAKNLVTIASEAGADAVKFQILDPDRLVADKKQPFSYEVLIDRTTGKTETITEPLYDILCRRALNKDEWKEIKSHCDSMDLSFFATIGFDDEINLLEELSCDSIKIASADVNHWPLIRKAARTGMCIQLDTGNATIGEIEQAVDLVVAEGNENIIIHNCPSGYPARLESINLRLIKTLKAMFPYPVAFSDHTPGWDMDIAAVSMGVNLIEKTITEDRTTRSVEHIISLEGKEAKTFIEMIRKVEIALGNNRRIMHPDELERRKAIRRSAFLKSEVTKGCLVKDAEIEFMRPGYGISPKDFGKYFERRFKTDLPEGHMINLRDFV
ncbi:N-acetylneuraminate synthase family protein [Thermodesulfobacteriota bacterium]